ncbi:MAG: DUF3048 C-terminal domain-containing protein [Clostridiales bacterium]|nr:DUF3048 C-terminal domain-containing protein [Clostridiales bacterium]
MNKQLTKLISLSTALLIMAAPLMGCGKKKNETMSYETWWTSTSPDDTSDTGNESQESTAKPTETTLPPPSEYAVNPFTGIEDMDKENVGKKGVGVTINNCHAAQPSRGTSEASVIYEFETEGGQTRMLCIFADVSRIPLLGSIRSGRVGPADLCGGAGVIFISWGSDETAVPSHVRKNNIEWIDINNNIYAYGKGHDAVDVTGDDNFCWYDREWMNDKSRAQEHCGVSRGDFLKKAIEYYKIDLNGETPELFHFVPAGTAKMTDSTACTELTVYFSSTNDDALFVYNESENVYYKSQYDGEPQMDINNNVQLNFTNVFVLYCGINPRPNDPSTERHVDIHFENGGTGYYVSYGQLEEITWTKPTPNDPIKCFDKNGNEIEVNAGKSYVCVVDDDRASKTVIK